MNTNTQTAHSQTPFFSEYESGITSFGFYYRARFKQYIEEKKNTLNGPTTEPFSLLHVWFCIKTKYCYAMFMTTFLSRSIICSIDKFVTYDTVERGKWDLWLLNGSRILWIRSKRSHSKDWLNLIYF